MLRFVPQAIPDSFDPVWATTITRNYAYPVFGIDSALVFRPCMAEKHGGTRLQRAAAIQTSAFTDLT